MNYEGQAPTFSVSPTPKPESIKVTPALLRAMNCCERSVAVFENILIERKQDAFPLTPAAIKEVFADLNSHEDVPWFFCELLDISHMLDFQRKVKTPPDLDPEEALELESDCYYDWDTDPHAYIDALCEHVNKHADHYNRAIEEIIHRASL